MDRLITDTTYFKTREEAIDYYFNYYRENGFPNYELKDYYPEKELSDLIRFEENSLITQNNTIRQVMTGCGFCWCFFPHWVETSTYSDKSLIDNWNDDDRLRKFINTHLDYVEKHEKGIWTINRFRQNAKVYCAKQTVSNFRPTVAKYIYNTYAGYNGKVFDPCGGWGGRLFGFLASNCSEYVCCEPSTNTVDGLNKLYNTFPQIHDDKKCEVNCICAEDYYKEDNYFDLVFTSPPYFDAEHYSEEETQSYIRHDTYDKWREGFLRPLIENSYKMLKPNKYFIFNIANTKKIDTLESDSVKIAKEVGFTHVDTLKMALSSISGKGTKYEPMFVFKKES